MTLFFIYINLHFYHTFNISYFTFYSAAHLTGDFRCLWDADDVV